MARRRRKRRYDGLAVGLMVAIATPAGLAAIPLYVVVADERHPRWWPVLALAGLSAGSLLLGLALYFGPRLTKDRLALQVVWKNLGLASQLPDDHPRKGRNDGVAYLDDLRFTSLEDQSVSLGVELLVDFPGFDMPVHLEPEFHPTDIVTPINLTPSHPSVGGDLSFQWNLEMAQRMGSGETNERFSLRIVDHLSGREVTIPFGASVVTTDEI